MMGEKGFVHGNKQGPSSWKYRVHPENGQGRREEPETGSRSGRVLEGQIPKGSYLSLEGSKIMGYYENSLQRYDVNSRDQWLSRNPQGTFLRENSGNQRSEVEMERHQDQGG